VDGSAFRRLFETFGPKLHGFFHYWLELERAEGIQKDPKSFPEFDAQVLADLRTSLFEFLERNKAINLRIQRGYVAESLAPPPPQPAAASMARATDRQRRMSRG